jgi:hypothetical protein
MVLWGERSSSLSQNNKGTFIPDESGIPTDLSNSKRKTPVGRSQYIAAGFQRTIQKEATTVQPIYTKLMVSIKFAIGVSLIYLN